MAKQHRGVNTAQQSTADRIVSSQCLSSQCLSSDEIKNVCLPRKYDLEKFFVQPEAGGRRGSRKAGRNARGRHLPHRSKETSLLTKLQVTFQTRDPGGCQEGITVQIPPRSLQVLWQPSWKEESWTNVLTIVLKHGGPKFTQQYLRVCTEQE